MQRTKISRLLGLILIPSPLLVVQSARAGGGQHPAQPSVIARYIQAIQKRDFKTIIDLTSYYQQQVAGIKAQNPHVLWPKLIGEYCKSKKSSFSQHPGYWQNYGESLGAMIGDPAAAIRSLQGLLRPECI